MSELVRRVAHYRVRAGFAAAVIVFWLARPTLRTVAAGAVIAAAGELVRVWAAGHLEKGREVTVSGPYRLSRHPLYLGSAIIGLGFAVATWSALDAVLIGLYLAVTLTAAIRSEESHLTEKFGDAYPDYRMGRGTVVSRRFSVQRVIANREYRAMSGLAAALGLLLLKAWT